LSNEEKTFSPACETLYKIVKEKGLFPIVERDRYLAEDVAGLAEFLAEGGILEAIKNDLSLNWD